MPLGESTKTLRRSLAIVFTVCCSLVSESTQAGPIEDDMQSAHVGLSDPFDPSTSAAGNFFSATRKSGKLGEMPSPEGQLRAAGLRDGITPGPPSNVVSSSTIGEIQRSPSNAEESKARPGAADAEGTDHIDVGLLNETTAWLGRLFGTASAGEDVAARAGDSENLDQVIKISIDVDIRDRSNSSLQTNDARDNRKSAQEAYDPLDAALSDTRPRDNGATSKLEPRSSAQSNEIAARVSRLFDFHSQDSQPAVSSTPGHEIPLRPMRVAPRESIVHNAPMTPDPESIETPLENRPASLNALSIGRNLFLGKAKSDKAACFRDTNDMVHICTENTVWPTEIAVLFDVNSILYQGHRTIVRYSSSGADGFYSVFDANNFASIKAYLINEFGQADVASIAMPVIGDPAAQNQVVRWTRPSSDGRQILELRAHDDLRDIMPDQRFGVLRLYKKNGVPIFEEIQSVDFLLQNVSTYQH